MNTITNTMIVVTVVSLRVGQVTFWGLRTHFLQKLERAELQHPQNSHNHLPPNLEG